MAEASAPSANGGQTAASHFPYLVDTVLALFAPAVGGALGAAAVGLRLKLSLGSLMRVVSTIGLAAAGNREASSGSVRLPTRRTVYRRSRSAACRRCRRAVTFSTHL